MTVQNRKEFIYPVIERTTDTSYLKKNTVVYIPISWSANQANERISKIPHNLNGFTLVFMFVVPVDYPFDGTGKSQLERKWKYAMDLGDGCIEFRNFFNGRVIVCGDHLYRTGQFNNQYSYPDLKTELQIQDPEKYDMLDTQDFIQRLDSQIRNPESIETYVNYNGSQGEFSTVPEQRNKIVIQGTCVNMNYSMVMFDNINAVLDVKDICFRNTLQADSQGVVDFSKIMLSNMNLPSKQKLILHYPFMNDLNAQVGQQMVNYLNRHQNQAAVQALSGTLVQMSQDSVSISGTFQDLKAKADLAIENYGSVQTPDVIALSTLQLVSSGAKSVSQQIRTVQAKRPSTSVSSYFDAQGMFNTTGYKAECQAYVDSIITLQNDINAFTYDMNMGLFMNWDLSILDPSLTAYQKISPITSGNISGVLHFADEWGRLNIQSDMASLSSGMERLKKCLEQISQIDQGEISSKFMFSPVGNGIAYMKSSAVGQDSEVKSQGNPNGVANALTLINSQGVSGMIQLKSEYSKYIAKMMMLPENSWDNIDESYSQVAGAQATPSALYSSLNDLTVCFWTKGFTQPDATVGTPFISVSLSGDQVARFSIGEGFFHQISNGTDATSRYLNDAVCSGQQFDSAIGQANWVFWCIRLDNTTGLGNDAPVAYRGKTAAIIDAYMHQDGVVKRHVMNQGISVIQGADVTEQRLMRGNYVKSCLADSLLNLNSGSNAQKLENCTITVGFRNYLQGGVVNSQSFNGMIRNMSLFAGHLTQDEIVSLFITGIAQRYGLHSRNQNINLKQMLKSDHFYLGCVNAQDCSKINIVNCLTRYSGKTYKN